MPLTVPWSVAGLARFPVKSMQGESLDALEFDPRGAVGDRRWAVTYEDGKLGSGKSSRRLRATDGLLHWHARAVDGGAPIVTSPDGIELTAGDPVLDALLSRGTRAPVHLAPEPDGATHMDAAPVSLATTASLRALARLMGDDAPVDVRRFRKNLLIEADEPWVEESWAGCELSIGGVRLRVTRRIERCVMTSMSQPGLASDQRVLRTITDRRDLCFGMYAEVLEPGWVRAGDRVEVGEPLPDKGIRPELVDARPRRHLGSAAVARHPRSSGEGGIT